jgi:hypothetical protein
MTTADPARPLTAPGLVAYTHLPRHVTGPRRLGSLVKDNDDPSRQWLDPQERYEVISAIRSRFGSELKPSDGPDQDLGQSRKGQPRPDSLLSLRARKMLVSSSGQSGTRVHHSGHDVARIRMLLNAEGAGDALTVHPLSRRDWGNLSVRRAESIGQVRARRIQRG